jgi:hypothetical protein
LVSLNLAQDRCNQNVKRPVSQEQATSSPTAPHSVCHVASAIGPDGASCRVEPLAAVDFSILPNSLFVLRPLFVRCTTLSRLWKQICSCRRSTVQSDIRFHYPLIASAPNSSSLDMGSVDANEQLNKKDAELSVPPGAPRPVLIIVMVSLVHQARY